MITMFNLPHIISQILTKQSNHTSTFSNEQLNRSLIDLFSTPLMKSKYDLSDDLIKCYESTHLKYKIASIVNLTGIRPKFYKDSSKKIVNDVYQFIPYTHDSKRLIIFGDSIMESVFLLSQIEPLDTYKITKENAKIFHTIKSLKHMFLHHMALNNEWGTIFDGSKEEYINGIISSALVRAIYHLLISKIDTSVISLNTLKIKTNLDEYIYKSDNAYYRYDDDTPKKLKRSIIDLSDSIIDNNFEDNWSYVDILTLICNSIEG